MCEANGNSLRQNQIKTEQKEQTFCNINLFFLNRSGSLFSICCSLISAPCFTDRLRQTAKIHFMQPFFPLTIHSLSIRRSDLAE